MLLDASVPFSLGGESRGGKGGVAGSSWSEQSCSSSLLHSSS